MWISFIKLGKLLDNVLLFRPLSRVLKAAKSSINKTKPEAMLWQDCHI